MEFFVRNNEWEASLEDKSGVELPLTNSFTHFHSALLGRNILRALPQHFSAGK